MLWKDIFSIEFKKSYFTRIKNLIIYEYNKYLCFPKKKNIFKAFKLCPFNKIKVVIIGQDPYCLPNQSNGLCFSVNKGIKLPPSLKNIIKEIKNDIGNTKIKNGDLTYLAKQGVLLLNSILSVRAFLPKSHEYIGWDIFTDNIINIISKKKKNIVFMLWGKKAFEKIKKIYNINIHYILYTSHPSPYSVKLGFFGCKHFSKCNNYLIKNEKNIIYW